jgi:8-oxo-dGTP pyrophosphatase MutT (NUDIX family)
VIVLDPLGRVLLLRHRDPASDHAFWATPGGGLQGSESFAQAARRELAEEVGLVVDSVGEPVLRFEHVLEWSGQVIPQREQLFVVRVQLGFEPRPRIDLTVEHIEGWRWWTAADLESTTEIIYPAEHLPDVLRAID